MTKQEMEDIARETVGGYNRDKVDRLMLEAYKKITDEDIRRQVLDSAKMERKLKALAEETGEGWTEKQEKRYEEAMRREELVKRLGPKWITGQDRWDVCAIICLRYVHTKMIFDIADHVIERGYE